MNDEPEQVKPRIQFRKIEEQADEKIDFTPSDDQRTVATRDSTFVEHKPSNAIKANARAFSPMGSVAVKGSRDVNITVTSEETAARDVPVQMDRSDVNLSYENKGITVLVRRDQEKSDAGIDGGHISRLTLAKGTVGEEEILAHYDKGEWLKKPSTFLENQIVMEAKKQDNGVEHARIKPAFSRAVDPEIDI